MQICYFNAVNNDQIFNVFMSNRINHEEIDKGIYFQIDRVKSKTNTDTFEANTLLQKDGKSNDNSKKFGVDIDLQKIVSEMIAMLSGKKQIEDRPFIYLFIYLFAFFKVD